MKKILLINDDANVRELMKLYLMEYEVFQAADGPQGLEQAVKTRPDLILLDVMMPGMDGYEVCCKLKENPETKETPVIFLSSLQETTDKVKGLKCGGVDFISSITDQGEILARVETHLKIQSLHQELVASYQELILKQQALNEDLHAAAMIQKSLLPINAAPIANINLAWTCHPCALVGGDICNIISVDSEHDAFYIVDVSGHGVPSAMVTVSISQYLQQQGSEEFVRSLLSPKKVLEFLNQEFPFNKFDMFFTIFYLILHNRTGKLIYSGAGHPPAICLADNKELKLLHSTGPAIGISKDLHFEEKEEILNDGDKIIFYTDGIEEFRNAQDEVYGKERFYSLLQSVKDKPVEEIVSSIMKSVREFGKGETPQDDISILGIEYKKR